MPKTSFPDVHRFKSSSPSEKPFQPHGLPSTLFCRLHTQTSAGTAVSSSSTPSVYASRSQTGEGRDWVTLDTKGGRGLAKWLRE